MCAACEAAEERRLAEAEEQAEEVQCEYCQEWFDEDDLSTVTWREWDLDAQGIVTRSALGCDDCTRTCERCDNVHRTIDGYHLDGDWYCEECTTSCPTCETTIVVGWEYCSDDCRYADEGCGCVSPALEFTIRNDGKPPLPNDERTTVPIAAGIITPEGVTEIQQYLLAQSNVGYGATEQERQEATMVRNLSYQLYRLDDMWQTKEGNYTKRLSKLGYQLYGLKLSPDIISQVGCIAREHSMGRDLHIEVTRHLNGSAEDFANEGSCWWGSESDSRCALKSNGGFALRSFGRSESDEVEYVNGRVWVVPLRVDGTDAWGRSCLVPTFETLTPDAFVVFNGYEDLGGYAGARVMAHLAGMTYRKVGLSTESMYINGGSGYLVAPEDIAAPYTDGELRIGAPVHSTLFPDEQDRIESKEHAHA